MSEAREHRRWSWDEYLEWEARQPVKHELVDGQVHAMAGGTLAHDTICNNLRAELRDRLRGTPCRVHGPDVKVRAGQNARYPDALIDCGPRVATALLAAEPVAVFEVLSKSTAWVDQTLKMRDFGATASVRYYVLISQDEPRVVVYQRDSDGHFGLEGATLIEGMEAAIELTQPDLSVSFVAVYEDVVFAS
jgi:Uma2 family endonuclease